MASYFIVTDPEHLTIATSADYDLPDFLAYVMRLATVLQEPLRVYRIRVNPYHEPIGLGETFNEHGASRVDQDWHVSPETLLKPGEHVTGPVTHSKK